MDNLAHTLAGAALAKAGLDRRTPLATPTLLIAANLPDVDVLSYLRDPLFALTFRRGWTHGILAMAVLPVMLAAGMAAWDRYVRRRRRPGVAPAPVRELLLVSLVGVLSHPLLDLLNTYGVRLLMPFSSRWFYGDTLFIIDPWLWMLLAATWLLGTLANGTKQPVIAGRETRRGAQAIGALALLYIGVMYALGQATRAEAAADSAALAPGAEPGRTMAAPVPANPFRRAVLFDVGEGYRWAAFDWRSPAPRLEPASGVIAKNFGEPAVRAALEHPDARAFLGWSRFPAAAVVPAGVRLYDLRYADGESDSWASVLIARASSARTGCQGYPTTAGSAISRSAGSPAARPRRRASRRWSPSK